LLLISSTYGAYVAGHLSMTQRISAIPVVLLSSSVSQVAFQRMAELRRSKRRIFPFIKNISTKIFVAGSIGVGVLVIVAPIGIRTMLGEEWSNVSLMIGALAPMLALNLVFAPLGWVFVVTGSQKLVLVAHLLILIVPTTSLALFGILLRLDAVTTLSLYGIFSGVLYGLLSVWALRLVRKFDVKNCSAEETGVTR
jgi:O-antigen/teichoic acid export membrane protein